MAKVQGKKAASTAKKSAVKAAPVKAAAKKKPAAKPAAKSAPKPKAKAAPKAKAVAKKVVKTAAKVTKKAAKAVAKSKPVAKAKAAAKAVKKPVAKVAAKVVAKAKAAPKAVAKAAAKVAPKVAAKPAAKAAPAPKVALKPAAKVVAAPAAPPKAVAAKTVTTKADDKKRVRRPRSRITSSGTAVATWFTQGDKPRSSSFIPAPPRAEAPSLIAAPPASSDRLVSHAELTEFVVRTVPVRVDIEQGAGRIYLNINPLEVMLRAGEGIEWDFRYLGGADVSVEDVIIEFEKPAPFAAAPFRSRRPGANRPHRQLSGPVLAASIGKRTNYLIRALNMFKTELAIARLSINILP